MTRLDRVLLAGLTLVGPPAAAHASDNTEGLDACLAAALQQQEGLVTAWEVEDGTGRGFLIRIVGPDGKVWSVSCLPATTRIQGPDRSVGTKDYAMLSTRADISEAQARESVRALYPGRFIDMQYKLNWRGGAVYAYTVVTPDDRDAVVEVDAASGRIVRSRSSARR